MSTGYGLLDAYLQQKQNGFQATSTPATGLLSTQAYQPSQTPGSSTSRYQAPDAIGAEYSGVPSAPGTANGFGNFALGLAIPGYNLARIAGDVFGIDALKNPLNALAEATGLDSLRSNSSYNVSNPNMSFNDYGGVNTTTLAGIAAASGNGGDDGSGSGGGYGGNSSYSGYGSDAGGYKNGGLIGGAGQPARGLLDGPGSATSDSIPAVNVQTGEKVAVSSGEYVVPADVVKAKGKAFFDQLVKQHHKRS